MALKLKGSTSGFVGLDAPAVAGNNTLILPDSAGSAGQILANDITAGVTTFTQVTVSRNGDLTVPGTISIGGTLTYEDVTSVDSVGVITARTNLILGDSLKHLGDENTLISFPANDTISAQTAGSERLRITSSGVVGINTVGARGATLEIQDIGSTGPCLLLAGATNAEGDLAIPDGQDFNIGHWNNSDTFTERFHITSAGKIGIGTDNPHVTGLTISGANARFQLISPTTGGASGDGVIFGLNGSEDYFINNRETGKHILFFTEGTERMRIASDGQATFDKGAPGSSNQVIGRFQAASSRALDIVWHDTGSLMGFDTPGNHSYIFKCNGTERARITSGGTFGLNTNGDPTERVHFEHDQNITVLAECNTSGSGKNAAYRLKSADSSADWYMQTGNVTSGGLRWYDGNAGAERFRVTSGGQFNISSTGNDLNQTTYRFQLTGSGGGEAASMAIKNEGSHPAKLHLMSGHGNWSVGNSVTIGDALEFRDEGGNGTRMYIDSSGNAIFNHRVGINFANPGARFVVSQNANQLEPMRIRDANNTNAVTHYIGFRKADSEKGSIKGDRGGTSFNTTSDYRLKQNVTSISDGITRIKQLLPKKFSFIEDETNTLRDGFLAHEVSSLVPEAVDGTKDAVDSDNKPIHQQIDHSKLVPLLTAALQEEIAKRESLEARVAALEG